MESGLRPNGSLSGEFEFLEVQVRDFGVEKHWGFVDPANLSDDLSARLHYSGATSSVGVRLRASIPPRCLSGE